LGKILGRVLRILAWLAPIYQFRSSVYRKCGIKIGKGVYIGNLVKFDGEFPEYITIDDWASIAPGVSIMAHSSASSYHQRNALYAGPPKEVHIRKGAWIASDAIILPGSDIGEGAIVAAGAVVSGKVEPFTLVAGNPSRFVRKLKNE